MNATDTTATAAVARRLVLLADIVRDRAIHPDPSRIDALEHRLRTAALLADTAPLDGGRQLAPDAQDVIQQARDLMAGHDFHLSAAAIDYALAPVTGSVPDMRPHGAVSPMLARDDFEFQKLRNTVLHARWLDGTDDDVARALRSLASAHYGHERLAEVIAVSNARPCNRGKMPYHLLAQQDYAKKAARRARTHEGGKLVVALAEFGIPAFLHEDRGVSCVLVAVDRSADENAAHTGPRVLISSGEHALRAAGEHDEPWAGHLYDADGGYVEDVFEAPSGLDLPTECAEAAVRLAAWLDANADRHPRA
ncbi:hypothetical protein GCM10010250_21730 [Streptomyces althioticus]|uniref:hypothetical protein n=1 Tax=Streptomyces althioticus TaxID=83380 RepID=UPI00187735FF|nr:hypothetical protein GCM10010250_21730 [Streptomyces althioticus]